VPIDVIVRPSDRYRVNAPTTSNWLTSQAPVAT